MKNHVKLFLVAALSAAFVFSSCSKDDNNNGGSNVDYKAPSVAGKTEAVVLPTTLVTKSQTDYNLMALVGSAQSVNILAQSCFTQFPANISKLGNASTSSNSDGSVTYTVKTEQGTFYLTYFYSTAKSTWTAEFQYTGTNSKMKVAYVEQSGTTGKAEYYFQNNKIGLKYEWTESSTGTNITVNGYNEETNAVELTWNIVSNKDKSGTMKAYDGSNVLIYDITWSADGTGSYSINGDGGTVTGTF